MTLVFFNLIENSVKYSHEGKNIDVSIWQDKHSWSMRVRNFGRHIPKSDHKKIFIPFARVSAIGEQDLPGTGIGLAAVEKILLAHDENASIVVESHPTIKVDDKILEALTVFTITITKLK